jgi:hypothetical protein
MDRILFGDNQFFGVNHISDEKSRQQLVHFKNDEAIIEVLDLAIQEGVNTFMCTTYARIGNICAHVKSNPKKYADFKIFPCMPYAHKYANAVTELGMAGAVKSYLPGNMVGTMLKGGWAFLSKDYLKLMEVLVDAEMKMFEGVSTPIIFLQNVVTDMLLGLQAGEVLAAFLQYVKKRYNAEAGFITMNLPLLSKTLDALGIEQPIICTSFNKEGFRMSGGVKAYEEVLASKKCRVIAMQIFGGGFIPAKEAVAYVSSFTEIESILFGASSHGNIKATTSWIREMSLANNKTKSLPNEQSKL